MKNYKNLIIAFFICGFFLTENAFGVRPLVCPDSVKSPEQCIGYYTSGARISSLYAFAKAKRHIGYMRDCKKRYVDLFKKSYFSGDKRYFEDVMRDIDSINCSPEQGGINTYICYATSRHSSCSVKGSGRYKTAKRTYFIKFVVAEGLSSMDLKYRIITAFPWAL